MLDHRRTPVERQRDALGDASHGRHGYIPCGGIAYTETRFGELGSRAKLPSTGGSIRPAGRCSPAPVAGRYARCA
jgi:hypothetical protein